MNSNYFAPILKTLNDFLTNLLEHIPNIIIAIIFFIFTYIIAKISSRILGSSLARTRMRTALVEVLRRIIEISIWVLGILIIAAILFPSVTPANLIATLGIGSLAIGVAFKNIFENFLAGILILLREPFHVGDYIKTKDLVGEVEYITVRNTHVRQTDGVRVFIPNSMLLSNPTWILTDSEFRRTQVLCTFSYDVNVNKVKKIIQKTMEQCKTINKEKFIQVYLKDLTENGFEIQLTWWTEAPPGKIRLSKDEVLTKIKNALDKAKIQISHTYTLSVDEPLELKLKD